MFNYDAKQAEDSQDPKVKDIGGAAGVAVSLKQTLTEMLYDVEEIPGDMTNHYEMMFGEEQHKGVRLSKEEIDLCYATMQLEMNKRAINNEHVDDGYEEMTHSEPRGSAAPALFFKLGVTSNALEAALAFCVDVIAALF